MIRLFLMRHGNTFEEGQIPIQIGARTDLPLTAYGRLQAEQMASYLVREKICPKAIFAGGLKRQAESAEIVGKRLGLPVQKIFALTEIDYGLWEGLAAEEIANRWPKEHAEWTNEAKWQSHIFRGSYEEHWGELQKWIDSLRGAFEDKTVIAITSHGLLRLLKNEKVNTGHFCQIHLIQGGLNVHSWNQKT